VRAQEKAPPLAPVQLIDPADGLTFKLNEPIPSGVCSVPLLEAHVDGAIDPSMTVSLADRSVAIPQVRVSAPAFEETAPYGHGSERR
jgi:hypothetical protein